MVVSHFLRAVTIAVLVRQDIIAPGAALTMMDWMLVAPYALSYGLKLAN
jgi:hypothetical protein